MTTGSVPEVAHLPREPLRDARGPAGAGHRGHHGRAARAARRSSRRGASCWRRSGSSSAPSSTWRCCASSATATGSRTTRGTSRAASPGRTPPTLMDYLPKDALVILDESHVTAPQLRGMYPGDRSRKEALVEYGFRLPSAFDNRPLTFEEFVRLVPQTLYVSATPGPYELEKAAWSGARPGSPSRAGRWRSRSSGPPGSWTRKITVRPAVVAGGRPHGRGAGARRARRAGADHHADQAHGRGPHRVLPAERAAGALPALRHRHPGAGGPDPRPAARASSTPSSASTSCARASTCPRSRWWRSWTRTRRATSAPPPR